MMHGQKNIKKLGNFFRT